MSAARSPICPAAPPTSPARSPNSAAGSPPIEGRVVSANSAGADRIQAVVGEINELGVLVKQLAISVASHDDMLPRSQRPQRPPRRASLIRNRSNELPSLPEPSPPAVARPVAAPHLPLPRRPFQPRAASRSCSPR